MKIKKSVPSRFRSPDLGLVCRSSRPQPNRLRTRRQTKKEEAWNLLAAENDNMQCDENDFKGKTVDCPKYIASILSFFDHFTYHFILFKFTMMTVDIINICIIRWTKYERYEYFSSTRVTEGNHAIIQQIFRTSGPWESWTTSIRSSSWQRIVRSKTNTRKLFCYDRKARIFLLWVFYISLL